MLLSFLQISLLEHVYKQEEQGKEQRAEDNAHETEEGKPDYHSENGDERMDVSHLFLYDEAYQVVELRNHQTAIERKVDGLEPAIPPPPAG